MAWFCRSGRRYKHRRHTSCWRNPFLVFVLSFIALGSLRFRTRTRTAAKALVLRHRNKRPAVNVDSSINSKDSSIHNMRYSLVETGTTGTGRAFERYAAVQSLIPNGSTHDSASTISSTTITTAPVTVQQWAAQMIQTGDPSAATALIEILQKSSFGAYFFETKGVTAPSARTKPFEFVLVHAPELLANNKLNKRPLRPNPDAFREHLSKLPPGVSVARFRNLAGDAVLVAPTAAGSLKKVGSHSSTSSSTTTAAASAAGSNNKYYMHLASFVRHAPKQQVIATVREAVAALMDELVGQQPRPVWLSTSGTGVSWLHFRIDQRPKYYTFRAFAQDKT